MDKNIIFKKFNKNMRSRDLIKLALEHPFGFKNDELNIKIIGMLYEKYEEEEIKKESLGTISFYDKEIEFLHSLPNEKIKRLFYSLLCFEKLHWHESGWIRFEIDELAELGGLKTLKCEDFADLVPFGLDMRVTGSKNAVTTYSSIWIMISQKNNGTIGDVVKTINGLECAEKFWEVVNASD